MWAGPGRACCIPPLVGCMRGRPGLQGPASQLTLTFLLPCAAGHAGRRGGRGSRQALLACVLGRALGHILSLHAVVELQQLLPQQVGSCLHTMHICVSKKNDACKELSDAAEGSLLAAERMRQALPKKLRARPRHEICFQVFTFARHMSNLPQAGLCPSVGVAEAEPASAGPSQESGSTAAATNRSSSRQQGEGKEYSANMTSKMYQHHVYMCKTAR